MSCSSMVEPSAVNGVVIGSSPIGTAKEEWQSGLMHLITNQKRLNNLRGFESYFFRFVFSKPPYLKFMEPVSDNFN